MKIIGNRATLQCPNNICRNMGTSRSQLLQSNSFFVFSVMTAVFGLLFYAVFIWYQDWTGKNRFSFRLLSLPGRPLCRVCIEIRDHLATDHGTCKFGRSGFCILKSWSFPDSFLRTSIGTFLCRWHQPALLQLALALPSLFSNYLLFYTIGYTALTLAYTFILMHLSGRWKGVFLATALAIGLIAAMLLFLRTGITTRLYAEEKYWMTISGSLILFLSGTWANYRLLEKRISV